MSPELFSFSPQVPEIISTLRQAGKNSARDGSSETGTSLSATTASTTHAVSPSAFAKKFEVLFCGLVSVAHKKAPPALIDECIEKFSQLHGSGTCSGSPITVKSPVFFKKDPSFPSLHALDENGLSPEISNSGMDPASGSAHVQPTSQQENRTMLFMVGRSQIYLVSPDTKKVAIEKSFKEISFCSQGIRHVDHFGFICRETVEGGSCHFVCYVFQCTDESLVDEIMLTLKQAFYVAAQQQSAKTQNQQCDGCPMQQLHRLCERIEGWTLSWNFLTKRIKRIVKLRLRLDPSLPPSPSSSFLLGDTKSQGFRRRASSYSHPPTPTSEPSAANKPKLVRHYSVSTDTPLQSNDVAALSSPSAAYGVDSPSCSHRHSWRQQIFLRVATPQKSSDTIGKRDPCLEVAGGASGDSSMRAVPEERVRRSKEELRELWQKAILQQILLQRMERENQKLQASESNLQNKRLKLDYEEITPCLKEITLVWEKMLATPGKAKVKFDPETIHAAVTQGVPRQHRGEIWKFLSEQFVLRQTVPSRPPSNHTPYKELLKQLTSQQHAILIDLGRTFPTHPYFQAQLGAGQLSLYNILKAYSLLDPEVGYCQGLSFIAGVLLLHMGEEDAFNMLKFLMYDVGLRKQYRPDMIILQIQMYQLSRLLHDYHRDLYSHLERQEIGPSLYATPWFLTAFASHFPLGFVARVFDMLFLQGSEVIFKVALSLLGSHKPLILQHESLESIVDFIKTTLPNLGLVQMEKTINQVCEMDISKQLQAYEVEYHVLQDELLDTPPNLSHHQRAAQLERTNQSLRQQNLDLLEELQVSHARACSLEAQVEALVQGEMRLKEQLSVLEQEKKHLASTVTRLQDLLSTLGVHFSPDGDTLTPPI
uniref:TBC1 domain family member 4 n=1 Tax=Gouania willdenowi TaxID=441366 RepID=A0A8C5ID24_GOUWI